MAFRLAAKKIFLTYPQCNAEVQDLQDFLITKLNEYEPAFRIGVELHEDGNQHFHVYISLGRKLETRDSRYFDFIWLLDTYHPNVQAAKNPKQVLDYVSKQGFFIDHGVLDTNGNSGTWSTILAAPTKDVFLAEIEKNAPRDFVLNLDRIMSFADYRYKVEIPPYEDPFTNYTVPQDLQDWVDENIQVSNHPNPIYTGGPQTPPSYTGGPPATPAPPSESSLNLWQDTCS